MKQGADDLEDDFLVDDIVALSGDEDTAFDDGPLSDTGEVHDTMSGEDDVGRNPQPATDTERKRKRREKEKDRKAKVYNPVRKYRTSDLSRH